MSQIWKVHRRTGGLEIRPVKITIAIVVHRRTGGLEKDGMEPQDVPKVHRRTGGLENNVKIAIVPI